MGDRDPKLESALRSLDGLSVGDAFGEACLVDTRTLLARLAHRRLPDPPWAFSDDTVMGISVAAAAAWPAGGGADPDALFGAVLDVVPAGITRDTIERASSIGAGVEVLDVVSEIGNGVQTLAQDTVPFALWCVRHYLRDYESALWTAAAALGDCDTLCASVGRRVH